MSDFPYLDRIHSPAEVRALDRGELPKLADELRRFLIESVSKTGGHLSSNLGTVELTVALHHVFSIPEDRVVWDVGHQTYSHKILTGRREAMANLRHYGGISGFPRRSESEYDAFGTAHSSTSISAALAMAVAARDRGEPHAAIAVIGDGAMSAGMAFEALNNAGNMKDINLLVILNDNEMSISPPVGALSGILARLLTPYDAARRLGKKVLDGAPPPVLGLARKMEEVAKGMVAPNSPGTLFEEFGFHYFGPVDGHDLDVLVPTLQGMRGFKGPRFLHVITRKGQGYKLAEADPVRYHGVSKFNHRTGLQEESTGTKPTYTQVFGDWLCDAAARDPRVIAITPAMGEGSGLTRFAREFPERYYDVGIAEQHALTFAAGLACEGYRPVVAIYSTFLQRAYDQLIHDIALQNLPVLLAIDRAGLAGADGATHHGAFDLSFLACIPNMLVMAPSDENECHQMLTTALAHNGPSAVRYPRGKGPGVTPETGLNALPIGKGEIRRRGREIALLAFGSLLAPALEAAETLDATVANMRFVKPLDETLVTALAREHSLIVTLEENAAIGGAGSEIARVLDALPERPRLLRLGLPDRFIDHGEQRQLLAETGLDAEGIISAIRQTEKNSTPHT
ncbi:MAG: 1-deoxy-D-xylulose-5-phosphate synthase [Azoarcus sp.]|jgi:1-deoxy-D-xylulose-5-phosphate synthase|nr:1-deoxy-D-xylulose-5-phosphate synthase [Azoarcus sp.]